MKKCLLLLFLFTLSLNGFSIRKKKQLQLIESCQLVYNGKGVIAGNAFNSWLQFNLKDGQVLYSNKGSRFGFKDFKMKLKGSGKSTWRSKRRLRIQTYNNAIHDPYIHLEMQMIDRPDVKFEMHIPLHFDAHYSMNFSASSGFSGSKGKPGRNGHCGRSEYFSNGNGEDGDWGDRGFIGRNGHHGANARDLDVYVEMVDFPRDNTKIMKIQGCYRGGNCWTKYVSQKGSLTIYANGGNGGDGGKGGKGGDGGRGGDGAFKREATECDGGSRLNGWGGNGGRGGDGGRGGNGGNGGDGANVYVHFADDCWFFQNKIHIQNNGGRGGDGGRGGNAGCGGRKGKGGKGSGHDGDNGYCGPRGYRGQDGRKGEVFYDSW